MTEQDKEIQTLRRCLLETQERLMTAYFDLAYVLNQHSLCEICKYADADCKPDGGNCVPKWRRA